MKRLFLSLAMVTVLLFAMNGEMAAQYEPYNGTPIDFSAWAGYSWTSTGVLGAELQLGFIGISAGWTPTSYPGSGENTSSFSSSISIQGKTNDYMNNHNGAEGACFYGSFGVASKGYRRQNDYGSGWGDNYSAPMMIVMGGVKSYANKWGFKVGAGYGWCDEASSFAWEIGLGYALFSNHSW